MEFRCGAVLESAPGSWSAVHAKITGSPDTSTRYLDKCSPATAEPLFLTTALHGHVGSRTDARLTSASADAGAGAVWATVVSPSEKCDSAGRAYESSQPMSVMGIDAVTRPGAGAPPNFVLPTRYTWNADGLR